MEEKFLDFSSKKEKYEARISHLQDQVAAQKEQLESNFDQLTNLEQENSVVKEDNVRLQDNVKAFAAEINELRTVNNANNSKIENLSRDNHELKKTIDRLNNQVSQLNATNENQLKKLTTTEEKLASVSDDLITNKATAEILDKRLHKSKKKLEKTRGKYSDAKSQILESTQSLEATNRSQAEK